MAFPVVPEKLVQEQAEKEERAEKTRQKLHVVASKVSQGTYTILDALILLTISFWYFFWTGLAILFKREIPKEWLKLGTQINKGRMGAKIQGKPTAPVNPAPIEPPKPRFKVVDLDKKVVRGIKKDTSVLPAKKSKKQSPAKQPAKGK